MNELLANHVEKEINLIENDETLTPQEKSKAIYEIERQARLEEKRDAFNNYMDGY